MTEAGQAQARNPSVSLTEGALNDLHIQLAELSAEIGRLEDVLGYVLRPTAPTEACKTGLSDAGPVMSPIVDRLYQMTRGTANIRQHLAEIVDRLEV